MQKFVVSRVLDMNMGYFSVAARVAKCGFSVISNLAMVENFQQYKSL
jgi:hypothetical protein